MSTAQAFSDLIEIMAQLRAPAGCPWDREQTHQSLRPYLLEETYEVLEALDHEKYDELAKELGDLLLQIIFHAQIASEAGRFTIADVVTGLNEKLIRRHPHVFGDMKINSAAEQSVVWEKLKKAEGKNSVLDGVPTALPALLRAQRLLHKASTIGFEWEHIEQVMQKFQSELGELAEARRSGAPAPIADEFGDVLFALVNVGRWLNLSAEEALRRASEKFSRRFRWVEKRVNAAGEDLSKMTLEKWEALWEMAKQETTEAQPPPS
ncbi:MAG: Nucleoside triphosphate pyrophosphohydrolase [bacterium]|nr:Nucleoside triphosphate pyrophosphohydrolase [bacterium]